MRRRLPGRDTFASARWQSPGLGTAARLERAHTIEDLRAIARRRTPRGVFGYAEGGADEEISLARARTAFRDLDFRASVLHDVSAADTTREVLGARAALPFGIAPVGFTRMMRAEGEPAGAAACAAAGIPFTLSTLGTTTAADVAAAAGEGGRNWFQLYVLRNRDDTWDLVERAAAAGFDTLLVTVDVPVAGNRLRDRRNGLTIPPAIGASAVLDAARHPRWWFDFLTTDPLEFASLHSSAGTPAAFLDSIFDPTLTLADVVGLRERWSGRLVVKGVQSVEDARRVAGAGIDGIVVSNHGGRQLDRAPAPVDLLPAIAAAVGGDLEVLLDGGIRSGADVVAALALGARFTLVGRAYLYGLIAGGEAGVARAIEILASEVVRTMKLLGVRTLDDLRPDHVRRLARP